MPIRFGVNFPAWFNPNFAPTKPLLPSKPQKVVTERTEVWHKDFHIDGLKTTELIQLLQLYTDDEFIIRIADGSELLIIYRVVYTDIEIEEKEFTKLCKDHERKLKEYEKFVNEFEMRTKKISRISFKI